MSTDLVSLSDGLVDLPAGPPPTSRAPTASACAPYRELIELTLSRDRNAMAIWQDLVDQHGFQARDASVRRYVRKRRGQRTPEAHPGDRLIFSVGAVAEDWGSAVAEVAESFSRFLG